MLLVLRLGQRQRHLYLCAQPLQREVMHFQRELRLVMALAIGVLLLLVNLIRPPRALLLLFAMSLANI